MKVSTNTLRSPARRLLFALAIVCLGCARPTPGPPYATNALPPGVSSDPAEFLKRTHTLRASAEKRRVRPAICSGGGAGCTVLVKVETFDYKRFDPTGPSQFNGLVARFTNLDDTDVEAKYGIDPYHQAVYYLHVYKGAGTPAQLSLLRAPLRTSAGGRVIVVDRKPAKLCHLRPDSIPWKPDVDFAEYKHPPGGPGSRCLTGDVRRTPMNRASVFSLQPFLSLFTWLNSLRQGAGAAAPIWLECDSGCCT